MTKRQLRYVQENTVLLAGCAERLGRQAAIGSRSGGRLDRQPYADTNGFVIFLSHLPGWVCHVEMQLAWFRGYDSYEVTR